MTATGATPPCDLCGLELERGDFPIHTAGQTLHFCCDGCREIYRLLHQPQEQPPPKERDDGR